MVFTLLYTPWVATVAVIGRELGGKWRGTLVVLWPALVVVFLFRRRRRGCNGCCDSCSRCCKK